jgi:RNA polymerase sigma-70 factor (ECF subfamily)
LYRIVYTTSISRTRSYKKDATFIDDFPIDEYHYNEIETAISSLVEEDRKRYVNLALQKLPQDENHIITLFYLMECSVEEISQITGLTRSNIKIKLFRARKVLYVELSRLLRHEVKSILDN